MPQPVRTLGRYEILRPIGSGGMAVVYLAYQKDLDRHVALKELRDFEHVEPEGVARFMRESRLVARFAHANIVIVHDLWEHDGVPVIVMEYLPRGSLRPLMSSMNLAQLAGVLEGMLSALAYAHGTGIVHRDLKPENVLVAEDGRVKLTDFGIAKQVGAATTSFRTLTGQAIGTPTYMSPEQATSESKAIGPRSDLYAVGVMAYEMLLGRPPFCGDTPMRLAWQHVHEPLPPPRSVKSDLDPELAGWLERMLSKEPDDRPANAEQAWLAFEDVVVELLSSRWRRDARLLDDAPATDTPKPLTPSPFPDEDDFFTFSRSGGIPPAPEPLPPDEPTPDEAVVSPIRTPVSDAGSLDLTTPARLEPFEVDASTLPPRRGEPTPEHASRPADDRARRRPRHRPRGKFPLVAGLVGAVAIILGVVAGNGGGAPERPSPKFAVAGPFRLRAPLGWTGGGPARLPIGLNVTHESHYAPTRGGGGLATGWVEGSTFPPQGLHKAPDDIVTVGDVEALRYRFGRSFVYVVPARSGSAVLACQGGSDALGACTASLGLLKFDGEEQPVSAAPDVGYIRRLGAVVGRLDRDRSQLRAKLAGARTQASETTAARKLANRFEKSRKETSRLSPPALADKAHERVVDALADARDAASRLRKAIADTDAAAYRKAGGAMGRADARLQQTLRGFRDLGYNGDGGS